jgi:hypothetical protein
MASATATAGVQSSIDVNSAPVISSAGSLSKPHVWTWIWFVIAVLVIMGFHIRVFGHPVPPAAQFP